MLAFFGLGLQEMILLAILGALGMGAVLVVLLVSRRATGSNDESELEAENRRLRAELDRKNERS